MMAPDVQLGPRLLDRLATTSALALLGLALGNGCAAYVEDGSGSAHEDGVHVAHAPLYYDEARRDPVKSVCWRTAGYAAEKQIVRDAVERSWEHPDESNVRFTGWGGCTSAGADVVIDIDDDRSPTTTSDGLRLNLRFTGWPSALLSCDASGDPCADLEIEAQAIHEFGHILGFAHEQNRSDKPAACMSRTQGWSGTHFLTPWDRLSVMLYGEPDNPPDPPAECKPPRLPDTPPLGLELSPWDSDGLRRAYGFPGAWDSGTTAANWCSHSGGKVYLGAFNDDSRDDLLCFDDDGDMWIDYASTDGRFTGTNWHRYGGWCGHAGGKLYIGKFNADDRDDLLCHDDDGDMWIDYASSAGQFSGTNWYRYGGWCGHDGAKVHVGDFNGDGRDDLICHDGAGRMWIDYADGSGRFYGTNWSRAASWCRHSGARIHIGKFNGDTRDDLLCHDESGRLWIDYADGSGRFYGTNWSDRSGWCAGSSQQLLVEDFNGDGMDDLLCHDTSTGWKEINFAGLNGEAFGLGAVDRDRGEWSGLAPWCGGPNDNIMVGKLDADGRADLLCHRKSDGRRWAQYTTRFVSRSVDAASFEMQSQPR